ncbi:MAG: hypothetical protein IKR90_01010 [Clostridia bacterium]|nr:hypothetical protein [Clostridia bacterium]
MSDHIELKSQKLGEGVCQKCGNTYNELNFTTLISSNKTKSYVLCNECLLQLQIKTDNYNAEHQANNTEEKPYESIVRDEVNTQTENSVQNTNTNDTPKSNKNFKRIIIIALIAAIIIGGCIAVLHYKQVNELHYIDFSNITVVSNGYDHRIEYDDEEVERNKYYLLNLVPSESKVFEYDGYVPLYDYDIPHVFNGKVYDSYGNEWINYKSVRIHLYLQKGSRLELEQGKNYYIKCKINFKDSYDAVVDADNLAEFNITINKFIDNPNFNNEPNDISKRIKDFKIEGKWKNIGNTSCAQMQVGSITSFDGTHCNVYSPSDTYAFYEQNGEYRLDCTSFFAGDSMNFTVRIIDNDNIELTYSEDTTVKLQRVG